MVKRDYWIGRLEAAWQEAPIVWLTGVRRVGKTTLARSLPNPLVLNCDLPDVARRLEDPAGFYRSVSHPVVVFDEIHQIPDPSRVLKIGADEFPHLRILATGSSTLAATRKFGDSLTGRKRVVHLLPVLESELTAFGVCDLKKRLLHGGLPEPLMASTKSPTFFAEWLDSFYARDVEELFRIGKRQSFLKLVEVLLRNSGGLTEVVNLAKECRASRPTVDRYLDVLDVTHVITLVRPYHGGGSQELVRQPKVYGFDTGFVSHARGWRELREEDCGVLWEHVVLESLLARLGAEGVRFWRDKQRREVDFVLPQGRGRCDAIECKWDAAEFSPRGLAAFRDLHPAGENYVVSPQVGGPYGRTVGGMEVTFCNLAQWESLHDTR